MIINSKSNNDLENNTESSSKALRYNEGKPQWTLVDFDSLEPLVRVLEFGATKYSRDNWKKGLSRDSILDSLTRHLVKLIGGEEIDEESKCHHMGHIMANAMFYIYFYGQKEKSKELPEKKERILYPRDRQIEEGNTVVSNSFRVNYSGSSGHSPRTERRKYIWGYSANKEDQKQEKDT